MTVPLGQRIDAAVAGRRVTWVVALDDRAATLVRRLAREPWHAARFATLAADGPAGWLDGTDGHRWRLSGALDGTDAVVLVATETAGIGAAGIGAAGIGEACRRLGITTAAVVVGDHDRITGAVHALRPWAGVLLTGADPADVGELLTALRA